MSVWDDAEKLTVQERPKSVWDEAETLIAKPAPVTDVLEPSAEDIEKYQRMGVKEYRSPAGKLYDLTKPEPVKPIAPPISPASLITRPAVEAAKGLVRGVEAHAIGGLGSIAQWAVESPFVKTADPGAAITDIATRWGPDWLQTFARKMQGDEQQVAKQAEKWADWWEEQANKGWEAPSPEVAQAKWREMPVTKAAAVIGEALPSYLSAITASVLTKNPKVGLLFLSGQVGAGAYRRQRKAGAGVSKANLIALMTGAWEYVTEKIPFEAILKPSQHLFRKMLKVGTYEAAQEFVQGIGENFLEYFGYEAKDFASVPAAVKEGLRHSLDGWLENIVAGAGIGGIAGAAGQVMVGKPPAEIAEPPKPLGQIPVEPTMPTEQMREEYRPAEIEPAPIIPKPTPTRPVAAITPAEPTVTDPAVTEGEVKIRGTPQEKKLVDEFAEGLTTQEWREEYQKGELPHWMTDKEPSPLSKELNEDLKKEGIEQANILEIGAGNGRDSIFLAKQGHTATGIDIAEQAVAAANKNASKQDNATFEKGNVEKLKYPDESFDAVFSVGVLHSTLLDDSLAEIHRVLRPGGIAKIHQYTKIVTAGKTIHYWRPEQIKQIAKEAGFSVLESHTTTKTDLVEVEGVREKIKQDNDIIVYTIKKAPAAPEAKPAVEGKVEIVPEEGQAAIEALNSLERFDGVKIKIFGSMVGTGKKGIKTKPHDIDVVFDVTSEVNFNHEHPFWEQANALSNQDKVQVWIRSPAEVSILAGGKGSPIQRLSTVGGQAAKSIEQAVPIEQAGRIRAEKLAPPEAKPAKPKPIGKIKAKPEVTILPEQQQQITKLRHDIHAVAAVKGLTQKALSELKIKHVGYRHLTGTIAKKKITVEQLQNLLKAVQKARPKRVGHKRVITLKTEKKIQSLKENLIKKAQMTEAAYADVLQKEIQGRQPKYIDSKNFITQTEATDILHRMHDTAEVVRITEPYEKAIRDNSNIASEVKVIDQKIAKTPKRDPYSLESMRYYNQQAQLKTGAPIFSVYQDLIDTHLENSKTRTATLHKLTTGEFKKVAKDKDALQRVSDYIASQSALKGRPDAPTDITPEEIGLAKKIQDVLKEYRLKVRTAKFFNWYYYQQPIPDHDRYRKEITKATDIYDSKGHDALIEYLKTQEWGIIKSGYEPLEVLFQKIRPYRMKPTTVGKGHIKIRTDIEYHPQERTILQRLSSYMRQMDMLSNLSPKINAYVRLYDDNMSKFNKPEIVRQNIELFLQNLKRYNIQRGWFERQIARAYSQAMRVIIMPSPVLAFRNLFQNAAFEHDKSILIDPRNKKLADGDIDYLETYVLQTRMMVEEYFMVGEKPLPGLKFLTKLIDKIKIYPYSDIANRHWSFWAKKNQVDRALQTKTTKEMMQQAKFKDMTELEQRRALAILAKDGKDAMARYVARTHVDDIHFLYERSQRSPAEMGGVGRIIANLMLFPRAYAEKLAHATSKMMNKKSDFPTRYRGLKILFAVIAGGMLCGAMYRKITGRRRNPYDPLELLSYEVGGLAWGAVESANQVYVNILLALKGDSRALAALTTAIPEAADMFIPFYSYVLRGIEAATDQKNIDRKAVRQLRMLIDKEYKARGGAYKLERNALEKWQYFIAGAGVDVGVKERQKKSKPAMRIKPMQKIKRIKRAG